MSKMGKVIANPFIVRTQYKIIDDTTFISSSAKDGPPHTYKRRDLSSLAFERHKYTTGACCRLYIIPFVSRSISRHMVE